MSSPFTAPDAWNLLPAPVVYSMSVRTLLVMTVGGGHTFNLSLLELAPLSVHIMQLQGHPV